jgi:hypothetical protein
VQCAWLSRKAAAVGRGRGEGGEEVRREEDRAEEAEKIFLRPEEAARERQEGEAR